MVLDQKYLVESRKHQYPPTSLPPTSIIPSVHFAEQTTPKSLWLNKTKVMTPMPHLSTVRGSLVCQGPAFLNNSETPRGLVNVKANCDCSHIFPDTQTQILPVMGDGFLLP